MKLALIGAILALFICGIYAKPQQLVGLNEENWSRMLTGEWMVEFFAPWCPACKSLQPIWEDFSSWSTDLGINVGQVDVTNNPGLSGRFMVNALPTIFHVKDGKFRQYRGSRDKEEFISFIEDKKWQKLEEVSWWKSPASPQMSMVSYFFKLSMLLRSIHNKFVDDYKFPFWASLLVFAAATIVIGIVLGLILVCVVDLLFPPKLPHPSVAEPQKPADDSKESQAESEENVNGDDGSGDAASGTSDKELSDAGKASSSNSDKVRRRKAAKKSGKKTEIEPEKNK
ncbi:hypothetical protein CHUAL_003200 [Chamberlinius hualienensis]